MRKALIILVALLLSQAVALRVHGESHQETAQHLKKGKVDEDSDDDIDSPADKSRFRTDSDTDFTNLDDTKIKNKFKDFKTKNGKKYKNAEE